MNKIFWNWLIEESIEAELMGELAIEQMPNWLKRKYDEWLLKKIETSSHHIHVDFPPEGGVTIIDVDCVFETVILNIIDKIDRILKMIKTVPLCSLEDAESFYRTELEEILTMCKLYEVKP